MRRNIWLLGLTSLFNDIASEATLRLLPIFLAQVLGASTPIIGLIEGVADSTATLTKLISGWFADRLPRRKGLVVAGYSLSGLTKPLLLIANHWATVLFIRFADRLGKGIRSAPRDALIADEAHAKKRGASFGLTRTMDCAGAVIGLTMAYFTIHGSVRLTKLAYQHVVIIAVIPATLAVLAVAFGVRETAQTPHHHASGLGRFPAIRELPAPFWRYLAVLLLFTLSNSSDAFLILKASHTGPGVGFVLICLIFHNLASTLLSFPCGQLSDVLGRKTVIVLGWLIYALTYAGFGVLNTPMAILSLFTLYGAYYALTEGAEKALVADLVPAGQGRGFAYGLFSFSVGVMAFPASLLFGIAIQAWGETRSFLAAGALAAASSVILLLLRLR